jgi:hypothetical protein
VSALGVHSTDQRAEVAFFQHAKKGFGRLLQTVDDLLAVAETAVVDADTGLVKGGRGVLCSTFVVNEAAQCQALRQNLAIRLQTGARATSSSARMFALLPPICSL